MITLEFNTENERKGARIIIENILARLKSIKWYGIKVEGNNLILNNVPEEVIEQAKASENWPLNPLEGGRQSSIQLLETATAENYMEVIGEILKNMVEGVGKSTIQELLDQIQWPPKSLVVEASQNKEI